MHDGDRALGAMRKVEDPAVMDGAGGWVTAALGEWSKVAGTVPHAFQCDEVIVTTGLARQQPISSCFSPRHGTGVGLDSPALVMRGRAAAVTCRLVLPRPEKVPRLSGRADTT
jgi:hypothetical protein